MIFLSGKGIIFCSTVTKIKQRKAKAEAQKKLKQKYRWNKKMHHTVGTDHIVC
jgi:hypothetical protein